MRDHAFSLAMRICFSDSLDNPAKSVCYVLQSYSYMLLSPSYIVFKSMCTPLISAPGSQRQLGLQRVPGETLSQTNKTTTESKSIFLRGSIRILNSNKANILEQTLILNIKFIIAYIKF